MIPVPNQSALLPVRFSVDVVGLSQQATVVEDLSDIACYKYKVKMEDGTEDIFTIIEGPELLIEAGEKGHDHYAAALMNDLYELTKLEPGLFYYVFPATLDGQQINMWMVEEEPDPGEKEAVMVSYHRKLQFQLYLTSDQNTWKVRELGRALNAEEKKLATELAAAMELMRSAVQLQN